MIGAGFALIVWPWWSWPILCRVFLHAIYHTDHQRGKAPRPIVPQRFYRLLPKSAAAFAVAGERLEGRPQADIFKIDEAWITKEKWGLLAWPLLAVALEWLQESLVFGAADIPDDFGVVFLAAILVATLGLWVRIG